MDRPPYYSSTDEDRESWTNSPRTQYTHRCEPGERPPFMEILVIGNPVAGRANASQRIARLVRLLERRGHKVDVFLTTGPGDARDRARRVGPNVERLVVAGGDGTINEVLNGMDDPLRVPIVHLPTGTANMLHRDLGLPASTVGLADVVENGTVCHVDMGLVGERRFLMLLSAGFDAAVTEQLRRRRPTQLGYTGYFMPIVRALLEYRPVKLRITVDKADTLTGYLAMVLNVRHYGGYFVFADRARLDSGSFEVAVLRNGSVPGLFGYAVCAFLRTMKQCRDVIYLSGRHVQIESEEPVSVQVDGDYFDTTPVTVSLVPASVAVVVPRSSG